MTALTLRVGLQHVARVDAALKAAGLDVIVTRIPAEKLGRPDTEIYYVTDGPPPPGVPRILSPGGPSFEARFNYGRDLL